MSNPAIALSDFSLHPHAGAGRQIAQFVREAIVSGRLQPGTRLPATATLAKRWKTHAPTVQTALALLTREGLLDRTPGKGTFVRQVTPQLTRVGVYWNTLEPVNRAGEFWRELALEVQHALSAAGTDIRVWSDRRPRAEQGTPLPELVDACVNRQIQGLLTFPLDWPKIEWLRKLPVPIACFASAGLPGRVEGNNAQFFSLAVQALKRQGCRRVGLISAVATEEPGAPVSVSTDFYSAFLDAVAEAGIETRSAWIQPMASDGVSTRRPADYEHHGFASFWRLWQARPRPDGLVVHEDVVSRGVVQAALAAGARTPDDLKLVLYRNRELGLHCPLTAAFMELSLREVTQLLIDQLRRQVRGEPCEPLHVDFRYVPPGQEETGQERPMNSPRTRHAQAQQN